MLENFPRQGTETRGPGVTPPPSPRAMCPMARMCERMLKKPRSALAPVLAGIVLIVIGALIFLEPRILVWLVGAVLVLFGIMLLMMARFIRRLGVQSPSR